jgi:hypothetical protein
MKRNKFYRIKPGQPQSPVKVGEEIGKENQVRTRPSPEGHIFKDGIF